MEFENKYTNFILNNIKKRYLYSFDCSCSYIFMDRKGKEMVMKINL